MTDPIAPSPELDPRYEALRRRDASAFGFYAVRTTGVFCRPGCASRLPKPANVAYFDTAAEARAAGFRACLRCRPEAEDPVAPIEAAIADAMAEIARCDGKAPSLAALAARAGYGTAHFHRRFRAAVGLTPKAYAQAVRARRAAEALTQGPTVTEAIHASGYSGPGRFYAEAAARLGMAAGAARRGAAGETIGYACADTSLGRILVAATARGVCAILFGSDDARLEADLARRFPKATRSPGGPALDAAVTAAVRCVDDPGTAFPLPLDLAGTAFQERVWRALMAIPPGETRSYAALAAAIDRPSAARAVARACADNSLGVVVPCHRVVGASGALTGYRWGLERKAALLAREKKRR